jgi:hypothetical protein
VRRRKGDVNVQGLTLGKEMQVLSNDHTHRSLESRIVNHGITE